MSNDSSLPNPDPRKAERKPPIRNTETSEIDLWDLDSITADALPSQQSINAPDLEETKNVEMMTEKSRSEPPIIAKPPGNESREWEDHENVFKTILSAISSLNAVEKIAISSLFIALALGATLTVIHFSKTVPTRPLVAEKINYPVTGKIVEIKAASTYWRAPVTTGENTDIVRRDTKLIPILKLNLSAKSGAIRVFFRDQDGVVIGDGISRAVSGETEVSIAATAGFDDLGMHTAYRTGDSRPWVAQVFEGPDATAPREKFRMILETEISTILR